MLSVSLTHVLCVPVTDMPVYHSLYTMELFDIHIMGCVVYCTSPELYQ
jgi:hypothetical protein